MAISRPVLVALIAAVLALAAFLATSGARQSTEESGKPATPAAAPNAAPAKKAAPSRVRPQEGRSRSAGAPAGMPAGLTRALARKRTVVLFFFQRGSADDAATARAVSSLRGRSGVQVFSAPISRLGDYGAVVGGAGVTQAPAVVIIGRNRSARLIEGFVDPETLAQQAADAR